MSKCKICQSKLRDDIDRQILAGSNFSYLAQWCNERGLKVTPNSLKRHAIDHLPEYQTPSEANLEPVNHQAENSDINPNIISFEAYCLSIGLEPSDFQDLEHNFDKIIYGSQKALSLLFFKSTAIVDFKITQHLYSESAYPLQQIKGLRSIFEMYAKITGIEITINENIAIKTLESLGYTISKN